MKKRKQKAPADTGAKTIGICIHDYSTCNIPYFLFYRNERKEQ
ncbi:MAG: hypothetical protein RSA73_07640 [Anaerovoracaceae bacterium]